MISVVVQDVPVYSGKAILGVAQMRGGIKDLHFRKILKYFKYEISIRPMFSKIGLTAD